MKKTSTPKTFFAAAGAAAALNLLAALPAAAQNSVPSYATTDETIHGTIASVNGDSNISVRDERGFIDNVGLRHGTVINPTGLTLAPGQSVTIHGRSEGRSFVANEIDTPYQIRDAVVVDPYVAYPYPYGAYPYPYGAYPYGYPSYHVGLFFGHGFGFGFHGR